MDPQQRILLETVYDGMCDAGLTIESLRGTSTSVFVGQMNDDWNILLNKDMEKVTTYTATGIARSSKLSMTQDSVVKQPKSRVDGRAVTSDNLIQNSYGEPNFVLLRLAGSICDHRHSLLLEFSCRTPGRTNFD